jgi:hypothetical protein
MATRRAETLETAETAATRRCRNGDRSAPAFAGTWPFRAMTARQRPSTLCNMNPLPIFFHQTHPPMSARLAGSDWQLRLPAVLPTPAPAPATAPVQLRYFARDRSVFVDGDYLIKGVAGAIFWKLARRQAESGQADFTTRELRLAADELGLPDVKDNVDVRLLLLQRRLAERDGPLRIQRTGRGRYRFEVGGRRLRLQTEAA